MSSSVNPSKNSKTLVSDQTEETINTQLITVLYYQAFCAYKIKDFDAAKGHLNEIWSMLNLEIIVNNEFLCKYFELCGLIHNFLGKYKLSSKYFQIYKEKVDQNERALFHQAKLELVAGNYIESCDYFTQLLLFYDSKENNNKISILELMETFGY